jgi:hypothetical protein
MKWKTFFRHRFQLIRSKQALTFFFLRRMYLDWFFFHWNDYCTATVHFCFQIPCHNTFTCTFTHQICGRSATFTTPYIFLLALFWPSFFCSSVFLHHGTTDLISLFQQENFLLKVLHVFVGECIISSIWAQVVSPCWSLCCFPPNYDLSMFNRDSYSGAMRSMRSTLNTSRWVMVCTLIHTVEPQSVCIYQLVIGERMKCL